MPVKTGERFAWRRGWVPPLRHFGWALLLAWVFCVFYTNAVEGYSGRLWAEARPGDEAIQIFFSGLPVFMSVVTLALIVGLERRLGSPGDHRALFWVAPLATALSTPFLFLMGDSYLSSLLLFVFGSVLTGFGSGFMWVMWGQYYAHLSQEEVERLAPASAIIAAICVLVVSSMSGWIALAVVTAFPLLSGLSLALSWRGGNGTAGSGANDRSAQETVVPAGREELQRPLVALRHMGRGGFGILLACLFVCFSGTFWTAEDARAWPFQAALIASIAFMAIISFASTVGPRRISISFLYRWMCPVLVVAFVALILGGVPDGAYVAYAISLASRFAFCLITQMFFARYAASGKAGAVQAFGFGWIFVHLGDFLGVLLSVFVDDALIAGSVGVEQVAAVSIAVLVIGTMYVLNDEKSFTLDFSDVAPDGRCLRQPALGHGEDSVVQEGEGEGQGLSERIALVAREHDLTPREVEVFGLLARGRSVPYIRDALVISKETASTHTKHVYSKLGIHSRQELIDLVS